MNDSKNVEKENQPSKQKQSKHTEAKKSTQVDIKYVVASINGENSIFQVDVEDWNCIHALTSAIDFNNEELHKVKGEILRSMVTKFVKQKKAIDVIDIGDWYGGCETED